MWVANSITNGVGASTYTAKSKQQLAGSRLVANNVSNRLIRIQKFSN